MEITEEGHKGEVTGPNNYAKCILALIMFIIEFLFGFYYNKL
jgi:hypothetical protein